jgi:hypothetical protein
VTGRAAAEYLLCGPDTCRVMGWGWFNTRLQNTSGVFRLGVEAHQLWCMVGAARGEGRGSAGQLHAGEGRFLKASSSMLLRIERQRPLLLSLQKLRCRRVAGIAGYRKT